MKIVIFILAYLRYGFSTAEVVASSLKIVEEYSKRLFIASNVEYMNMSFSIGDIARNVSSKYEDGALKMYMLLPIKDSVILDEWYIGYFSKSGKFIEAL
ncbi:hypothetical protein M2451_003861 [Dysgonomonas sp. PFB1-18]|uniref:hypothetical protein n=1 Tax=unclassified Dysgonomonas TaxID=2630389 RepID=UPI0024747C27|nr:MULTISPECIES: hypothetical protein [unclassified Dysgonomonas]MDH6311053.1 hypothetical protein [Dysgonomonas sp. PF1-14]MDH6341109.1 hypothetical protein [Dysgonomonas sp. PF1-16]MDH6382520.1 hypothetical protein [Dysgonomonas sp. PFB1-18]MDH6400083.1 hypothetical protein [Dysgonomonas sp. PF1-23]